MTQSPRHLLVVEDEPDIAELLAAHLRHAGYRVSLATDGRTALARLEEAVAVPDLLLLDLMLPDLPGTEVLRAVRARLTTPVIVLTARGAEADVVECLALGADDHIAKPVRPRVLLARIEAVLRRSAPAPETLLRGAGEVELDLTRRELQVAGRSVRLTPGEFELLAALLRAPGRVFGRYELLEAMGGLDREALGRAVDNHVRHLRRKLGPQQRIETVFGVGYRYAER